MEIKRIRDIEKAFGLTLDEEAYDRDLAEHKTAIRDFIIEYCTNEEGNIDLTGLDFRHFNGDIVISGMQVKGNLIQSHQQVYGNLIQCYQTVGGDLDQSCQIVEFESWREVAEEDEIFNKKER